MPVSETQNESWGRARSRIDEGFSRGALHGEEGVSIIKEIETGRQRL